MFENLKTEDLARLAAYIDGEGHISITEAGPSRTHKMQLTIGNTDIRLMVWLKERFGGEVREKDITSRKRRYWYWYIGADRAADLLSRCLPYFVMKRDQAEIAIAFRATACGFKVIGGRRTVSEEVRLKREMFAQALKQARENAAPVIN